MSNLTKKRVHWFEKDNGVVTHDEDVDVLTSADAVTFDDGDTLQRKYDDKVLARTSDVGNLKGLSTTNKSSLVDAVNEVFTSDASNKSSIEKHVANKLNPHGVTKSQVGLGNADNTSDINKPVSTAQQNAINSALSTAKDYTDTKVANLVGAAPETLDTLEEVAQALAENDDVVEALNNAIGSKASQIDFNNHKEAAVTNEAGSHGFRYYEGKLQAHIYDEESQTLKWVTVPGSGLSYDNSNSGVNSDNVQGAIDDVVRTIGYVKTKNLLPNITKSVVNLGLTFTYNSDGTVTVNGTATEDYWYDLCHRITSPITLKKISYILSGCANGGSDSGYYMAVIKTVNGSGEEIAKDYGNGVSFTLNEDTNVGAFIFVKKGTTVNNLVFKPMLRYASIADDSYEPYVPSVKSLICDVEVISKHMTVATTTTLSNVYTYTAQKRCLAHLTFGAYYSNSAPVQTEIRKIDTSNTKITLGITGNTANETAQTVSVSVFLNANDRIEMHCKYKSDALNNLGVNGYIQYLE